MRLWGRGPISTKLAAVVRPSDRSTLRAALAVALLSAWLVLLFVGWIAAGAVHLLLAAALAAFPWRAAVASDGPPAASVPDPEPNPDEEETP